MVGANFLPSTAINQLEMWQAETWDPKRIDYELGLAQGIGMNTMRVFLHDQLWTQDPEGFKRRIDEFLSIASHELKTPLTALKLQLQIGQRRGAPQDAPWLGAALRQVDRVGYAKRDSGLADSRLRANQPLAHRRWRHQKSRGDGRRIEA